MDDPPDTQRRAQVTPEFKASLEAMSPEQRSKALREYLETHGEVVPAGPETDCWTGYGPKVSGED